MSETKEEQRERMRRIVIHRHRRNKNLCIRCGLDPHDGECIEVYTKSDMRIDDTKEIKIIDLERKKKTIISYRKKKNLCVRCGKEPHNGLCIESYDKSDTRNDDEKSNRPAIISTSNGHIMEDDVKNIGEQVNLMKSYQKIILQRDFIVVNLAPSTHGNIIEYSCLNQLSKRFKDYIICTIGFIDKVFTVSEAMQIHKFTNVMEIKSLNEDDIASYIVSCKKLFTYPDVKYFGLCLMHRIPIYQFPINKNATNIMKSDAYNI